MVGKQQISTWEFCTDQLRWERLQFYRALQKKIIHQIVSNSEQFPHLAVQALELGKQTQINWIVPELVYLAQSGLLTKKNSYLERYLNRALELLLEIEPAPSPPTIRILPDRNLSPSHQSIYYAKVGLDQILKSFDPNIPINMSIGTSLAHQTTQLIKEALSVLQTLAPSVHDELTGIIREVVLLDGSGLRSSSVPLTFGLVYLQPDVQWQLPNVVDLLVHECAHHSLVIKTSLTKMVVDSQLLIRSPLREDGRPVNSVLHALFVLMRVCYIMMLWLRSKLPGQAVARSLLREYSERLREGITTMQDVVNWTDSGAQLFATLKKGSEALFDVSR